MPAAWWPHPWLRAERALRVVLADRLTRGATTAADQAVARVLSALRSIERAGWFN